MSVAISGAFAFSNTRLTSEKLIVSYVITLLGRHRHIKAQFFYNRRTQSSYSIAAKGNNNLQELLRRRFGLDAIGILVDGDAWYSDEELLKANVLDQEGGRYYVLYDDNSPSYSEAPKASKDDTTDFPPHYYDADHIEQTHRSTTEVRIHGLTYFTKIPSFTIKINLRTAGGKVRPVIFHNKDISHIDQLLHHLSEYGGNKWVGVKVHGIEYVDDGLMFSPYLKEDETYDVTYAEPSKFSLSRLGKRDIVYSAIQESERTRPYE